MTLETWLAFLLAAGANVVTPGPAIALAIRNGLSEGLRRTLYSTIGNVVAIGCIGFLVSTGLGALVSQSPDILGLLRLAGGSYLVWMAINAWKGRVIRLADEPTSPDARRRGHRLFLQSLFIALTNPKMLIFLIALFPLFIDANRPITPQLTVMTLTFMALSFLSLSGFALTANRCARLIRREKAMILINRIIAAIFFIFGTSLFLSGLHQVQ